MIDLLKESIEPFMASNHIEVQERACFADQFVKFIEESQEEGGGGEGEGKKEGLGLSACTLFDFVLNPVTNRAQRKVPVPQGLLFVCLFVCLFD